MDSLEIDLKDKEVILDFFSKGGVDLLGVYDLRITPEYKEFIVINEPFKIFLTTSLKGSKEEVYRACDDFYFKVAPEADKRIRLQVSDNRIASVYKVNFILTQEQADKILGFLQKEVHGELTA